MPPQTTPESSNADFGFMLKQQQPQTGKSSGRFSSLAKPAKLLFAAVAILVVVVVAALVLGSGSDSSKQVVDLMAQSQEIVRVSEAQDTKFSDANTKGLSATTQAVMNSQKFQLSDYLTKAGAKYDPQQLAAKMNSDTDTQLQTAAQNNNLDSAYNSYLKTSLTVYVNSLNTTFQITKSPTLKSTLQSAYESVQTLLNSPQFKS